MALNDEGGSGIPATMLVAPSNYPIYGNGGGGNGNGFGDGNGWWIILLFILLASGNWGNNGNNGGFAGGSQPIMIDSYGGGNVQRGFDQAAVMSGINGVQTGVQNLSTQLCNCCGDISAQLCNGFAGVNATVNGGFANAETAANSRQMANMNQMFAMQTANTAGLNGIQAALANCCCENRLATNDLKYTIATENCADRAAIADGIRDILAAQTAGIQSIKDQLCQDKIDAKNDIIAQLRQEVLYARSQASQDVQTARILAGQAAEVDGVYNRLRDCPVPTMPVYGMTPIFTCANNNNSCGCGCNNNF